MNFKSSHAANPSPSYKRSGATETFLILKSAFDCFGQITRQSIRLLVIRLCVLKGELLMGEMVLHGEDGGGCMAAWRSSRDGKQRPGNGNRYRFRARQIGLNNLAQTHSTSRSHTHRRQENGEATRMQTVTAGLMLLCVMLSWCKKTYRKLRKNRF